MVTRTIRAAAATALLAAAACSSDDADVAPLPIAEAERARELAFTNGVPPISRITAEAYASESEAESRDISDEDADEIIGIVGRLGYLPEGFDVRATGRAQGALVAAYYSTRDKAITLIGDPPKTTVIHELVHALQDQNFDLARVTDDAKTTDESLAVAALVEGDAEMAELRAQAFDVGWALGMEPRPIAPIVGGSKARELSERVLDRVALPPYYLAYTSFAYSYGAKFIGTQLGIFEADQRWSYGPVNTLFAKQPPKTTETILRGREDPTDALVTEIGLSRLPAGYGTRWDVVVNDRLGAYFTYLMFRGLTPGEPGLAMVSHWDGDQLIALKARDDANPPRSGAKKYAIVWTSIWDDAASAEKIAEQLRTLHGAVADAKVPGLAKSKDGEELYIATRENKVVVAKNLTRDEVVEIGDQALSPAKEQGRLPTRRKVKLVGPRIVP